MIHAIAIAEYGCQAVTMLILTTGSGYGISVYERFLKSLRKTGCTADVVIALPEAEAAEDLVALCSDMGANLATFKPSDSAIVLWRFKVFQNVLNRLHDRYQNSFVLHTDIRDVLFQSDPFSCAWPPGCELYFALEDAIISDSRYNCEWLRLGFGKELLAKLASCRISCAGTTYGSFRAMTNYVDKMCELIFTQDLNDDGVISDRNDQGVHNYLLYTQGLGRFNPCTIENSLGLFYTFGTNTDQTISELGKIVLANGVAPAITHQIDRLTSKQLYKLALLTQLPFEDLIGLRLAAEATESGGPRQVN